MNLWRNETRPAFSLPTATWLAQSMSLAEEDLDIIIGTPVDASRLAGADRLCQATKPSIGSDVGGFMFR
jgi:hypothetical protein